VGGPGGTKVVRLLVDTGSRYTILPVEILIAVGCDPTTSQDYVRLIAGNGIIVAPQVSVEWLNVFGHQIIPCAVIAHTIPFRQFFDGLLGMDVLTLLQAHINVPQQVIEVV
jgi:predicted aspartyl protease